MALVKCKECGEDVSSKAKTCPKCGAKVPKKTSLFTWLVLLFIILVVYVGSKTTSSTSSSNDSPALSSSQKSESNKAPPPKPAWSISTSKDEMTGEFIAFAYSPTVFPTKIMSFPYKDVTSWMGVGCNSKREWVYFGFSTAPNLMKAETKNGYNLINTRVKWNSQVENVTLTQNWGDKFIHFRNDNAVISKISASTTALLELHWYGQKTTFFEYSLNGSSKAIDEIRAKCAKRE